MRLSRLRIRTMMIAVAVIASLLTLGVELRRLSRVARERQRGAELHRLTEDNLRAAAARGAALLAAVETQLAAADTGDSVQRQMLEGKVHELQIDLETLRRQVEHAAALTRTHERAARRPWEAVPPDPPEPR